MTFEDVCWQWWDFKLKRNRGDMPRGGVMATSKKVLENDVIPSIGSMEFTAVRRPDLIKIIRRIEERGAPETTLKTCSYLKQIYNFALLYDYCDFNLADNLGAIVINRRVKKNNPYLDLSELKDFKFRLENVKASHQIKKAAWFMLFTGARGSEIRKAEIKHFDFDKKLWNIPAIHIKQLRSKAIYNETIPDYIMPLSDMAIKILKSAIEISFGDKYIFSSPYKENCPININALNDLIRKMGYSSDQLTAHGLRATMSTALNESGLFRHEWIEAQLTHADTNIVRGTYNHALYLPQRLDMMNWWATEIEKR